MPEMIGAFTKDEMLAIIAGQAEAGNAIVVAGLVEDSLEKLLLTAGRKLTNTEADRMFSNMGPLSSFSAKIEIAYLFDLIDEAIRDDLRIIKSIRNNFAHTTRFVRFSTEHIAKGCRKLSNWREGASPEACYRDRAFECVKLIMGKVDQLMFANALKEEPVVSMDETEGS